MNSLALIFSMVVVAVSAQYHSPEYHQAPAAHAPSYGKGGEATSFQSFHLEVGNQEYKQPEYESGYKKPSYHSAEPSYHHSAPEYGSAPSYSKPSYHSAPSYSKPSYHSAPSYSKPAYKPSY